MSDNKPAIKTRLLFSFAMLKKIMIMQKDFNKLKTVDFNSWLDKHNILLHAEIKKRKL